MRDRSHRPENPAPARVLVVDGDPLMRWALTQTLLAHGCDVVEGGDAEQARKAVEASREPFDVILLDYRLPDSEGLSLLELLHALSPRTRIVLMAAFGSGELTAGALTRGAAGVVAKPFDMRDVPDLLSLAPAPGSVSMFELE